MENEELAKLFKNAILSKEEAEEANIKSKLKIMEYEIKQLDKNIEDTNEKIEKEKDEILKQLESEKKERLCFQKDHLTYHKEWEEKQDKKKQTGLNNKVAVVTLIIYGMGIFGGLIFQIIQMLKK